MTLVPDQQSHLLGIILAVHSTTAGDQLIFRYPPVERNHLSEETGERIRTESAKKSTENCPKGPSDPPVIYFPHSYNNAYNIPSVVLCSILCPRFALCDQVIEFMVDDAKFIGRPTTLSTSKFTSLPNESVRNAGAPSSSVMPIDTQVQRNDMIEANKEPNILTNASSNNINSNSMVQNDGFQSFRSDSYSNNNINTSNERKIDTSDLGPATRKNKEEITMFNFMLVIEKKANRSLAKMCYYITSQVANAIKHEEQRCGYLTTEVTKMFKVREKWLTQQSLSDDLRPDHKALTYELLQASTLANAIKDIFHALREEGSIQCKLNNWITLSLSLNDYDEHSHISIRPYQTLLILDPPELLKSLLPDSSPSLRKLIEVACPKKTFRELSVETGIPLNHLYRLAAHLVYWNKARIINTLAKTNVYVLNPNPKCSDFYFPFIGQKFSRVFPAFRLPEVLESFSVPKKLGEHVLSLSPTLQKEFVEVVIWLLRHDFLMELHTFVFFVTPDEAELQQDTPDSNTAHVISSKNPNTSNNVESDVNNFEKAIKENNSNFNLDERQPQRYLSSTSELSSREKHYLEKINDGSSEYQLLVRLCPYFRGCHHLEEIM